MWKRRKERRTQSAHESAESEARLSLWRRLNASLGKTRQRLSAGVGDLLLGQRAIDDDILEDLESSLLTADVGVAATERVMESLKHRVTRRELADTQALARRACDGTLGDPRTRGRALRRRPAAAPRGAGGRRQRRRQDHAHRQAGAPSAPGRRERAARGRRHVPRRRRGAAASVGAAQRRAGGGPGPRRRQRLGDLRCGLRR